LRLRLLSANAPAFWSAVALHRFFRPYLGVKAVKMAISVKKMCVYDRSKSVYDCSKRGYDCSKRGYDRPKGLPDEQNHVPVEPKRSIFWRLVSWFGTDSFRVERKDRTATRHYILPANFPVNDIGLMPPPGAQWWQIYVCGLDSSNNPLTPSSNTVSMGPVPSP